MKVTKNFMHDLKGATDDHDVNTHKTWDESYPECWKGIKRLFDPNDPDAGYKKLKEQEK